MAIILAGVIQRYLTPAPPPPDTPGLYVITGNSVMPYEHRPLWQGTVAGATARINRFGFRGDDISPTPAPGVKRLAVVGDSVVFGQRLKEPETLPAQVRELLQRKAGLPVETINAGVRGYSSRQYPAQVKKVLALNPNMVILVITLVNDPEREQWRPESEQLQELKESLWTKLPVARSFALNSYSREINRLFIQHVESLYQTEGPEWKAFLDDLRRTQKLTEEANVPMLVVIFPMMDDEIMFEEQTRQLEAALDESGIRWVNPEQDLRSLSPDRMVVGPDDSHPSAEAMSRTAESIFKPALDLFSVASGATPESPPAKTIPTPPLPTQP